MLTNPNLVEHSNGRLVTNSLLVAEKFKKQHAHVMRTLNSLISANPKLDALFVSTTYTDEQGKERPMYVMNRDGFSLLVMGFTGKDALNFKLEFIEAFNSMEEKLKKELPRSEDEIIAIAMNTLTKRIEVQKQQLQILEGEREILSKTNKILAPKAEYTDKVLQSTNTYTTTQIAKEIGISSADKLHKMLYELGVIFRQSGQWMLTAKYCGKDYTKARTHTYTDEVTGVQRTNTITVWTEKGRKFIHELIKGRQTA